MGIKFYCPNGHKLNVKSFLRGKKAICPKCGVKVVVPEQSVEGEPDSDIGTNAQTPAKHRAPQAPGQTATVVMHAPPSNTSMPVAQMPSAPAASPQAPAFAAPAATIAPPGGAVDPIDEAPEAVWYVRPPSGGQFGPAPGETMRAWVNEGRVTASSLVWRAGWPEWRSAAAAFPRLAPAPAATWGGAAPAAAATNQAWAAPVMPVGMAPAQAVGMAPVSPVGMAPVAPVGTVPSAAVGIAPVTPVGMAVGGAPLGGVPTGLALGGGGLALESFAAADVDDPTTRSRKRRRKKTDTTLIVSVILVVLTVVLCGVLAVVLSRQGAAPEEPAHAPPAGQKPKPEEPKQPAMEMEEEEK